MLLEHGANPNLTVSKGFPIGGVEFRYIHMPLFQYSLAGIWVALPQEDKVAMLSDMLAYGAQVDRRDMDGNTALIWATRRRLWNAVPLLLDHHADVNARNKSGETALCYAVRDVPTLRLLLDHGAKANVRDWEGKTALMAATEYLQPDTIETDIAAVRLLLNYGAAVDAKDRDGETALSRLMDDRQTPQTRQMIAVLKQAGAKELPANRRRRQHHYPPPRM